MREAVESQRPFPLEGPVNTRDSYTIFPSLLTRLFHLTELARRLTLNDDGNLQRLGFPLHTPPSHLQVRFDILKFNTIFNLIVMVCIA